MDVKVCPIGSEKFNQNLLDSVIDTGFVVITNHGIDKNVIRRTQQAWREFFLEGQEIKKLFINEEDGNMGYKGMLSEKAVGASKADLKEFFHWKQGEKIPHNCSHLTKHMFAELGYISSLILRVLDLNTAPTGSYRAACEQSDNTILRTLYYPAMNFEAQEGAVRAAAHEDINFITLLVAASAPGLQVLDKAGNWHSVPHEENSIVVNIGDMMELASKGIYKSTTHRVINPDNNTSDRISMPLFVHPASDTLLAPGFTAQEFLNQRIAEIYQK